ncbi:MAG: aminotransferase class I/II-fold pyridoxal phosphate-dependent enzyme [SAR86 cluster bacterium]|nr:aminotransferase class I/II-fold pyridoxal phosphate-dependent enzyme [SAR86 cluster bacterium]
MKIESFELERIQSIYENSVDVNLTESGIEPMSLKELMSESELEELVNIPMGYGYTQGSPELRAKISSLYKGFDYKNILVTSGSSEAIFLTALLMLSEGDELIMMSPNYLSINGIAKSIGAEVSFITLEEDLGWSLDLDKLRNLVSKRTKLISLCNPNNPTGSIMKTSDMEEVVRIADSVGAYIHSDEIYIGSELSNSVTTSFQNLYKKTVVTSGLSKTFANPGIRIGWLATQEDLVEECWGIKDYTTVASSILSQHIACKVLEPQIIKKIKARARELLLGNLKVFKEWIIPYSNFLSYVPPEAGGFVYVRYNMQINSSDLIHNLRENESVFIVPGDSFGMDGYFRVGLGSKAETFKRGLNLISKGFSRIFPESF